MRKMNGWLALCLLAFAMACNDDDDKPANAITSEEAAVIVSSSFASNTSGVAFVAGESADATEDMVEENEAGRVAACGISKNLNLSGESPNGAAITWSYDFSYKFKLNCSTEELPESVSVTLSYSGDFDGPKLAAEHSGLSEVLLTGLEEAATQFKLEGLYKRSGSFEQKEGEMKSGSNSINVTLTDIAINKTTHAIASGTATYTIEGSIPEKGNFKYDGTVTFNGTDNATLKVGGDTFVMNLKNGEVNKNQ